MVTPLVEKTYVVAVAGCDTQALGVLADPDLHVATREIQPEGKSRFVPCPSSYLGTHISTHRDTRALTQS